MIGERLKKFRKQQGLSQEEFADRLCISQSWYCKLEKQSIGFTTDVLYRICKELKIDVTQLLNANMEITPPPTEAYGLDSQSNKVEEQEVIQLLRKLVHSLEEIQEAQKTILSKLK